MKETTLANFILGRENFKQKYSTLKNLRVFSASSVRDFLENKKNLNTPLSDLIFLSNPNFRFITFRGISINKLLDEVYELGSEEKGYLGRKYKIYDRTGEITCFWPTENSKIPAIVSCDHFERMKIFKGGLVKTALINYDKKRGDIYLYHIDFDMKEGEKNENLVCLTPNYV